MPPNSRKPGHTGRNCVFCNDPEDNVVKYGKIYEHEGIVTHYFCLLLSSNMQQRGEDDEGIMGFLKQDIQKELVRGEKLACAFCRKRGATLGCVNKKCKRTFHLPCGLKNNSLHQFFDQFKSFCPNHRPNQIIDPTVRAAAPETLMCYICYELVRRDDPYKTLWAPCCKKNAWFHRDCVQQLALNAGYFFKCPLCNNTREFKDAMKDCGIFIPDQDASWELEPHAFEELLYRHKRCDAQKCVCPSGREHTGANAKWELVLCRTCGSQGVHMACGKLRWLDRTWNCSECTDILHISAKGSRSGSGRTANGQASNDNGTSGDDSGDSDSTLGRESPFSEILNFPSQASVPLRPGPRCAKLKQLQKQAETRQNHNEGSSSSFANLNDFVNEPARIPEPPVAAVPVEFPSQSGLARKRASSEDDIIIVDSDDEAYHPARTPALNSAASGNVNYNNSVRKMPISGASSMLPAGIPTSLASAPIVCIDLLQDDPPTNASALRKADPLSVLEILMRKMIDSMDKPFVEKPSPKRQKTDGCQLSRSSTSSQSQPTSYSVLSIQNPTGPFILPHGSTIKRTIFQGMDTANAFTNLAGQECILPLTPAAGYHQSNSDGDAGTRPAGPTAQYLACTGQLKHTMSTAEPRSRRRRRHNDHGTDGAVSTSADRNLLECSVDGDRSRNHRNRLSPDKVALRDLKFRVNSSDSVQMTVNGRTININVDMPKRQKTVNNSLCSPRNGLRLSPRIWGLKPPQNTNDEYTNVMNLSKSDSASDMHLTTTDSVSYHSYGDKANLCKYEYHNVFKENLVPDKLEHVSAFGSLCSIGRRGKRSRHDHDGIEPSLHQDFSDIKNEAAGTSRDGLKEFSMFSLNQIHYSTAINNCTRAFRRVRRRQKSFASSFDQSVRCRVSIDLNRIKSLLHSSLLLKKNSMKLRSHDDLKLCLTEDRNFALPPHTIRRSKSEGNILSLLAPTATNFSCDTCPPQMNLLDYIDLSQENHRRRRRKLIDKYECVR